ncbi:IclR family transcriptional regulator domain-containing protein [Pseudonocardia sp. CA-107938]|uniref:IclR family transcriptional regulator domain-containing protein n=1 Tax=Pseudonocardia sp. CA-107938 TaxID=3240021 RepID=UPI003D8B2235
MSDHVRSLERGLAVLRAFDADAPVQTLSDVARRAGLTRAAARRFLLTLAELGYVRSDGRLFQLTPKVLELGYAYLSALTLPEVAGPHLEALSAQVHESASMSVLDGADIVYVARVATSRLMTAAITIGTRLPAYASAMGRVMLAARPQEERAQLLAAPAALTDRTVTDTAVLARTLDDVAAAGWALVEEELELGVRSIAVPVHDARGAVVAAVNVAARPGPVDLVADVLPHLRATVAAIETDLRSGRLSR